MRIDYSSTRRRATVREVADGQVCTVEEVPLMRMHLPASIAVGKGIVRLVQLNSGIASNFASDTPCVIYPDASVSLGSPA